MLTKEERDWLNKLQKLLDKCPSTRLGFYTIGDPYITVYDASRDAELSKHMEDNPNNDFCWSVSECDADLGTITFPNHVHSTSG